ncbi:MAG: RICIN domain-containing protein [Coriobacteriales bacterium]|jgi:hypothetical protein|nr:RICIN domain-containing protein [Coriobacteriales bacterium]
MMQKTLAALLSCLLALGMLGLSVPAVAFGSPTAAPGVVEPAQDPSDTGPFDPKPSVASASVVDSTEETDSTEEADATEEPDSTEETDTAAGAEEAAPALAATLSEEHPVSPGSYYLRPAVSHTRVLDVAGGSVAGGANIQLWGANKTPAQRFELRIEDGSYVLVNEKSNLALDVAGGLAQSGTNVWQYTQNGTDAQKWAINSNGDGSYTLVSALNPEFVLDVSSGADAHGANIQIYRANNTAAQSFSFMPAVPQVASERTVVDGVYTISSALPGALALDIPGASDASGERLQLYTPNGTRAQMFDIRMQADGFYLIRSMVSGLALDVAGGSLMATAAIQQYRSNGTPAQRWAIRQNANGSVQLISQVSGLALDVVGAQSVARTPLQQYYPNAQAAGQSFQLTPAAPQIPTQGIVSITPYADTSLRVDIAGASRDSGARAQAHRSNGTVAQKYEVSMVGSSSYSFRSLASGLYLTQEGSNVFQRPAPATGPSAAQQWAVEQVPGGVVLTNRAKPEVMTVADGRILTAQAGNDAAQIFRVASVHAMEPGCYILSSATGLALDVAAGSHDRGAYVQLYANNDTGAQKWDLTLNPDGFYTVANAASEKVLDIAQGSLAEGARVWQWDDNGTAAQRWKLVPTGDGWFYLQSQSGSYLSAAAGGSSSGDQVCVSRTAARGNGAQKFMFTATTYTPPPQYSGTFADVNLTTQRMIFVKDSVLILETDIVSGAPSMATPPGTFRLAYKTGPTVLVGPGYREPVSFWMPFNDGIGFHDAPWQPEFGGTRHLTNGSHGCINMPYEAARTLYNSISAGDLVVVHY